MILRLLNVQGIAGLAIGAVLAILLALQAVESRHWKKQSAGFEQLYRQEQAAAALTAANLRAAAGQARAADRANAGRVAAEQRLINQRSQDDFESRLAAARAAAERVRVQSPTAAADPGDGGGAFVPGLPAAARGAAQAPGQDRLPPPDALTATEQAIQLDELIKWVRRQHAVQTVPASAEDPVEPAPHDGR